MNNEFKITEIIEQPIEKVIQPTITKIQIDDEYHCTFVPITKEYCVIVLEMSYEEARQYIETNIGITKKFDTINLTIIDIPQYELEQRKTDKINTEKLRTEELETHQYLATEKQKLNLDMQIDYLTSHPQPTQMFKLNNKPSLLETLKAERAKLDN